MKLPQYLSEKHATGEREGEAVAQFEIGNYQNFVYLILDWTERKAAIVDPQQDLSAPLSCLKRHGFELTTVLLTHTHFDHIAGVPELIQSYPHVPIIVHRDDLNRLDPKILNQGKVRLVNDLERIQIGQLSVQVLHTPGHSAGECSYLLEGQPPSLFTGDTVFIRDCGRTDFESGNTEQMFHSLQRIKKLPPETRILPGHHYQPECASTLEVEMKESAPLLCQTVEELAALP